MKTFVIRLAERAFRLVAYPDDLPQETEDEVRLALGQVVSVDVDDVAADRLRRVQGKRQVLVFRVQRQVSFVDGTLVDRIRARVIDDFAAKNKTKQNKNGTRH